MLLHSWNYRQIKELVTLADAENVADSVSAVTEDARGRIEIDGSKAAFTDRDRFTFPLKQTLRSLPNVATGHHGESQGDRGFITALTVKEASDR